ncbi:hypothetical protein JTB14_023222 [Gonioctena quinquepunctata]|nr:hypothetical protein JTB14_023222 [Gonioctena quinquepunctata]
MVDAHGITKENKKETVHLVVKYLKSNEQLRKIPNVYQICETEVYMYNSVFRAFKHFLVRKKIRDVLISVPKCYNCIETGQEEVIVMDNLKAEGYKMNDTKRSLNFNHLKAILMEYGKLHALSFALKDQNRGLYQELTQIFNDDIIIHVMETEQMIDSMKENLKSASETLKEWGDISLNEKFSGCFPKHPHEVMSEIIISLSDEPQTVIVHDDCWNNNYLFKYQGEDLTEPVYVKIIDWQLSGVRSPVFDLSNFIHGSACEKSLEKFNELLECYYESFSTFLEQLGSDPKELFTFSDLKRHWNKYGFVGVIGSLSVLKITLSDEIPELPGDGDHSKDVAWFNLPITDREGYHTRLRAIISHYFSVIES